MQIKKAMLMAMGALLPLSGILVGCSNTDSSLEGFYVAKRDSHYEGVVATSDSVGLGLNQQWSVSGDWLLQASDGRFGVSSEEYPAVDRSGQVSVTVTDGASQTIAATLPYNTLQSGAPSANYIYLSFNANNSIPLYVEAVDPDAGALSYAWTVSGISNITNTASTILTLPLPGRYDLSVDISDDSSTVTATSGAIVSTTAWPFFRGTRQGIGSIIPRSTQNTSGRFKWKTAFTGNSCATNNNFVSGAIIGIDGTLYVGSWADGKLYAFNPDTGEIKWSFITAGSRIINSPVVASDGTIYVVEFFTGMVHAVNSDGTEKWRFATGAEVTSPITIGVDGSLYIGTDNGASSVLYALNADGSQKWASAFALAAETRSSVNFGADGTIYARDYAGYLYAINPSDGSQKWRSTVLGTGSGSSPVVGADGIIYFDGFSVPYKFYALNPDGSLKWETDMGATLTGGIGATASIAADGIIYIGSWEAGSTGALYAVNPADGSVKWRHALPGPVQAASSAVGADGRVYVASNLGVLYALDPTSGTELWTYDAEAALNQESPGPLSIGSDGSLYLYSCDGVLHAVQ